MRPIDEKIVSMRLDNKQFEKNARDTITTLGDINNAAKKADGADFSQSIKGASNLQKAVSDVDMSSLVKSVDNVASRFSNLGIVGMTALQNITNKAVDTALALTSKVTTEPFTQGFQEYGLKLDSTQTILANVKRDGKGLEDVNRVLADMNEYSDQTIYNFAQMTKNMSLFTNAGIELDSSAQMIKGLMNEAAVSGASNEDAQRAAYQISQALNTGTIKLMDWKSVTNANMGGKNMRDAIAEIAYLRGYVDDTLYGEIQNNFNASLEQGWFDTAILEEYLNIMAGGFTEAELIAAGYSEAQSKMFMDQYAEAQKAATQVRTIPKLLDTAVEQVGSKWAQIFELIIGDFETAPERLTTISEAFGASLEGIFNPMIDTLTLLNEVGALGAIWDGLFNVGSTIATIIGGVSEIISSVLPKVSIYDMRDAAFSFRDITQSISDAVTKYMPKFVSIASAILTPVKVLLDVFTRLIKMGGNFLGRIFGALTGVDQAEAAANTLDTIAESLSSAAKFILDSVDWLMDGIESFVEDIDITPLVDFIKWFVDGIKNLASGFTGFIGSINFGSIGSTISSFADSIGTSLGNIWSTVYGFFIGTKSVPGMLSNAMSAIGNGVNKLLGFAGDALANVISLVTGNHEALAAAEGDVENITSEAQASKWGQFKKASVSSIDGVKNKVVELREEWKSTSEEPSEFSKIISSISEKLGPVKELVGAMFDGIKNILSEVTMRDILTGAILIKINRFFKGISQGLSNSLKNLENIFGSIASSIGSVGWSVREFGKTMGALQGPIKGFKWSLYADALKSFGVALLLLAAALFIISKIDPDTLESSLISMGAAIAGLVAAMYGLSKINMTATQSAKIIGTLMGLSLVLVLMSGAMKRLAGLDAANLGANVFILSAFIAALVGMSKVLKKGDLVALTILKSTLSSIAMSLLLLSLGMSIIGNLDEKALVKSAVVLSGVILILGLFTKLTKGAETAGAAAALIGLAIAINLLVIPLIALSLIPIDKLLQGVGAIGALVIVLKSFVKGQSELKSGGIVATLMALAIALNMLIVPIVTLGSLNMDTLLKGIGAFAAILLTIAGVGMLASSASAGLFSLAAAIGAIALTIGAIGVGMIGIGIGIAALVFAVKQLLTLGPAFVDAISEIVRGIIEGFFKALPEASDGLIEFIARVLEKLAEHIPEMAQSVMDIIVGVLNVIADNIQPIMEAVTRILKGIVDETKNLISQVPTDEILDIVLAIGAISIIARALTGLPRLLPRAMLGIGAAGILLAEVGAILYLFGHLADEGNTAEKIEEGGEILKAIGEAIGGFVGGLIASFTEAVVGILPAVGEALSGFINEARDFLDYMGTVDVFGMIGVFGAILVIGKLAGGFVPIAGTAIAGIAIAGVLAGEIILVLGALEDVYNFVGGSEALENGGQALIDIATLIGSIIGAFVGGILGGIVSGALTTITGSFPQVGQDLSDFATNAEPFFEAMKKVDSSSTDGMANLISMLGDLAGSSLTNAIANILDIFGGGNAMGDFGDALTAFATSIVEFVETTKEIDPTKLTNMTTALQEIAKMADMVPNSGGIFAEWTGDNTIDQFGKDLVAFGSSLVVYSRTVAGVNPSAVSIITGVAVEIVDMNNRMEKAGGLAGGIFGDKNMDLFGVRLVGLGEGLMGFYESTEGIDTASIDIAIGAVEQLRDLNDTMEVSGGLLSGFGGEKNLGLFGDRIGMLGDGLGEFITSIEGLDVDRMSSSIDMLEKLIGVVDQLQVTTAFDWATGEKNIAHLGSQLEAYGGHISAYYDRVKDLDDTKMIEMIGVAEEAISLGDVTEGLGTAITEFGDGMTRLGEGLRDFHDEMQDITISDYEEIIRETKALSAEILEISDIDSSTIQTLAESVEKLGQDSIEKFKNAWVEGEDGGKDTVNEFVIAMANHMVENGDDNMLRSGKSLLNSFIDGMKDKEPRLKLTVGGLRRIVTDGLSNIDLYSQGANASTTFVNGISSASRQVQIASAKLANTVSSTVANRLEIHSPSMVMARLASYTVQGYVNDLIKGRSSVKKAASSVSEAAYEGMASAMDLLSQLLDYDYQFELKVKPVLDLSELSDFPTNQNGVISLSDDAGIETSTKLTRTIDKNDQTPKPETPDKVEQNNYYYEGMMDGAHFYVREDADIDKIRKAIQAKDAEEVVRNGGRRQ